MMNGKPQVRLNFIPQAWVNDYAIPVDPEGETEWVVDQGKIDFDFYEDHYKRDDLRYEGNAPQWIQVWDGPFEVVTVDDNELP
ncbi:MAG: hypothetical protein GY743_23025 [Planctomycetaceae bacterium]|nr:hypothetical protein [Planctomycetaceae bacterium]